MVRDSTVKGAIYIKDHLNPWKNLKHGGVMKLARAKRM